MSQIERPRGLLAETTRSANSTKPSNVKKFYQTSDENVNPLFVWSGNQPKQIGTISEKQRIFTKKCKPSHILRFPPAIAIQASVVDELKQMDCKGIKVIVTDGRMYQVPFESFLKNAHSLDRGFGRQLFLELDKWRSSDKKQLDLF